MNEGDVIVIEGEQFIVDRIDEHNSRIHFKGGYSIRTEALCSDNVSVME